MRMATCASPITTAVTHAPPSRSDRGYPTTPRHALATITHSGVASIKSTSAFRNTEDLGVQTLDTIQQLAWFFSGCYFIHSGATKLGSPTPLWAAIMPYRITGLRTSRLLAAALPPIEFSCGLLLASRTFPAGSAAILIGLLIIFSAGMVVTLIRGQASSDGGCGPRPSPVSPALVLRNLILIAALAPGVVADHPPPRMDQVIATAVVAIIAVGVSVRRHQALTTQHTTPSQRPGGSFTD